MSGSVLPRRVGWAARRFLDLLILQPFRNGRLRDTGWPSGLRVIVACATAAFVLAVALVVTSPLIRSWLPLSVTSGSVTLSVPRAILPLFFALVVFSVALLQAAALHLRWAVAIPITLVTSLVLLFLGGLDQGDTLAATPLSAGKAVSLVAVVVTLLLLALRRRRGVAWWEFVVILSVVGLTAVVSLGRMAAASAPFGIDFGPPTASLIMSSLGSLAVPAAMAAGVAVAELAITAAVALVGSLRGRASAPQQSGAPATDAEIPDVETPHAQTSSASAAAGDVSAGPARGLLLGVFLVLAALLVAQTFHRYLTGSAAAPAPEQYSATLLVIGVVVAGWVALALLRRRHGRRHETGVSEPVSGAELMARLNDIVLPVAAALTALLGPVVVVLLAAQILFAWGVGAEIASVAIAATGYANNTVVITVLRVLAAVVFVVLAAVGARRGRRAVPELLFGFGVIVLASSIPALGGVSLEWSSEAISVVIAAVTVLLTLTLAVRRRLGQGQLAALCIALLLAVAAAWRDVLADPLSALLGASAIAFILLGLVWGFLVGAEATHGDSPAYPVGARVLLFLANSVFAASVLAFAALARDLDAVIDLEKFADVCDVLLVTALIVILCVALWSSVLPTMRRPPLRPRLGE